MDYPLFTKLAAEFFGTAILMIFGNGSVANVELKNTKGHHAGWLNIAMGYGFGVMFPVLMFGSVSGAHINPAMTIAQAVNGLFPWSDVLPYIVAQLLGALLGQLIVYITYYPHYKETEDAEAILGTFCTTDADNQKVNYFLNEMFGTLVLVFGALCCLSLAWGKQDYAAASIVVGFIVWGLVTSMGGPTGPGLNPARDLMPRLLHAILPIPHKGEQTDVPESADWYNSSYIIAWGSNVPQTRTPDAHFFTEVRYKGTKTVAVTPDYAEIAKLCDLWLAPDRKSVV